MPERYDTAVKLPPIRGLANGSGEYNLGGAVTSALTVSGNSCSP